MKPIAGAILGCLSVTAVSAAWGLDITGCGQQLLRRQTGVLTADLACGTGLGLSLEPGATLDLAGHTLTVAVSPVQSSIGVYCRGGSGGCSVIRSTPAAGEIRCEGGPGDTSMGVQFPAGGSPVESRGTGRLSNVAVHGCDLGVSGRAVDLRNAEISGNRLVGVTASSRLRVVDSTISQNSVYGVSAGRVRAAGSTITGNGKDVYSVRRPTLRTTTCDTSVRADGLGNEIGTWGICALD